MPAPQSCSIPEFNWTWTEKPIENSAEFSQSFGDSVCSVWVWCPCTPFVDWSYCSRSESESCPQDDVCEDKCRGDGSWYNLCGDSCLGPPCHTGRFYGEVSIVCQCPTSDIGGVGEEDIVNCRPQTQTASFSCDQTVPTAPHPWAPDLCSFDPGDQVPKIIFPPQEYEDGAFGMWTWCPCPDDDTGSLPGLQDCLRVYGLDLPGGVTGEYAENGTYNGKPKYEKGGWVVWYQNNSGHEWWISSAAGTTTGDAWMLSGDDCPIGDYAPEGSTSGSAEVLVCCPYDAGDCKANTSGDGKWVFRGGCKDLGPPPVDGRFYGETIAVGYCCEPPTSSSSESSSSSMVMESSSYSLCSMPIPPIYLWDLLLKEQDPEKWPASIVEYDNDCGLPAGCSSWLWCQCEKDESSECLQVFGDPKECPMTEPAIETEGEWSLYSGTDHHGAPCVTGRFYGEILWFCKCDETQNSSSQSEDSSSAGCVCEPGGMLLTNTSGNAVYDFINGYANPVGTYNGMPYYEHCETCKSIYCWTLAWRITGPGTNGKWYLTSNADLSPSTNGWELSGTVALGTLPDGLSLSGTGSYPTGVDVDCCDNCDDCSSCPANKTIVVSGASPWNDTLDNTYTATRSGCDYYDENFYFPGDPQWDGPDDGCIRNAVSLECECGVWYAYIIGDSCTAASLLDTVMWMSDGRPSAANGCPPNGSYSMHLVYDSSGGAAASPTFTVS